MLKGRTKSVLLCAERRGNALKDEDEEEDDLYLAIHHQVPQASHKAFVVGVCPPVGVSLLHPTHLQGLIHVQEPGSRTVPSMPYSYSKSSCQEIQTYKQTASF